jgi:bacteriocin biosynthesis cyclodehydratase domain-containing protein
VDTPPAHPAGSGILPVMVLKIGDDVPMVWRSPTSLQLGIDAPRIVLDEVGAGEERLIAALRRGISASGWSMLARDAGVPEDRAGGLLAALAPLLSAPVAAASGRVLVLGDGPIGAALAALLQDAGRLARPDARNPELVALVTAWVIGPEDAQHWLRRDVPHLPVVVTDRTVTVGPLVEPGSGPCLYCGQLARTDADPAWPAIAAQLWGRPAPHLTALTINAVAGFAARRLIARLDGGAPDGLVDARAWRLADEGGTISSVAQRRHPGCSCAAPPESDWAPGSGRAAPDATTTTRSGSVPA